MDEAPRRDARRHHLKVGAISGLVGLLAAAGAATAVAAFTGSDRESSFDLHFTADDADGAVSDNTPLVGKDADGASVPTKQYELLTGGLGSLGDHKGTPMVINFWYSTCLPCRQEMPAFQSVSTELRGRVAFVGLAVRERAQTARDFVKETGVTYETGLDPSGALAEKLAVVLFPSTVLVDGDGKVVATHRGALTAAELRALIDDKLL
jgi:thiol-disulfide isomerase/thioredoxin